MDGVVKIDASENSKDIRLKPGDQWCLCAPRWAEAFGAGCAPQVVLAATHERTLDHCRLEDLVAHAVDAP
jgi:uncharacterized protein (DUF2237 family)